jgi:hypothetical protein
MSEPINLACSFNRLFFGVFLIGCLFSYILPMQAEPTDDANIAKNLADMLRAARQVISSNQARINDPTLGDKGLTGRSFCSRLSRSSRRRQERTRRV